MTTPDPSAPATAAGERRYSYQQYNRVAGTGRRARLRGGARWQPVLEALATQFRQEG